MRLTILFFITLLISSCSDKQESNQIADEREDSIVKVTPIDTTIGSKEITDEIPGANYRKRARAYFTIVHTDTSSFMPIFSEELEEGKINITVHFQENMSYREQYEQLKKVLPQASKDFNFDSLQTIYIGRLISSGDLAVEVSREYLTKMNLKIETSDYAKISSFLSDSKLGKDFNAILKPYNLIVEKVSVEKVFLTDKKDIFNHSNIESDSAQIPAKILDCLTWIKLKPAN